jgi:hypothetical protein
MTRVYRSSDRMLVDTYRSILGSYGIGSDARITGLWVLDDAKADRARSIIAQTEKRGPGRSAHWRCGKCGELTEGHYHCWKCGGPRSKTNA